MSGIAESDTANTVRTVSATGDRSIAIGGDAINSLLVTGDNNTFFVGQYERLQDAYLNPRVLYQELGLTQFTGRDWLVAAVDRFLARHDRGYLVLEAEAGMGKSTFLAWIARERGYVSHFVRLMPNPDDIGVAMRNLTAQLIRAWDLDTYAAGGILPPAADRPEFFQQVLSDAASRRDSLGKHEPIVIAVDGLNETAPVAGLNPLGLPTTLPAGVYVIVSQRTVYIPLRLDVPREVIRIEANSPENQRDASAYLQARAVSDPIRAILQRDGVEPDDFVRTLLAKSRGVWVYLHYVLADIAQGRIRSQEVDELPIGLWHYYAQYWHQWQRNRQEQWHELDLPLLSVIAAAAEPLSAAALAALAGTGSLTLVEELLDDPWRPFLQVEETDNEPLYRAFHDSLREFLSGHIAMDELTVAERSLARRLAQATKAAHARIADRYLNAWGGLQEGLPALTAGHEVRDGIGLDGGYGFRHIVDHLVGSARLDDLHAVMTLSTVEGARTANLWFAVHRQAGEIGAYRRDVNAVWNVVRRTASPTRCAAQIRYALISSSLNSMAEATPPALWSLLVALGRLTAREALSQARQIPTAEDRAEALTGLIGVVGDELRDEVEREAMAAVRAVPDEFWRVGELLRLHQQISAERRTDLLPIVRSLVDPYFQVVAYRVLGVTDAAPVISAPRSDRGHELDLESPSGMAAFASFVEDYRRRRQLAASRLNAAGFSAELPAIDHPGSLISDPSERYWTAHLRTVAALNAADPEDARRLALAALEAGENIGHHPEATTAWLALGTMLATVPATRAWAADHLAAQVASPLHRIAILLSLTAASATASGVELDSGITDRIEAVGDDRARAALVAEVAPTLARCGAASVQAVAALLDDPVLRAGALLAVAEHAQPADAGRLVAIVVAMVKADPALSGRAGLLSVAAPYLSAQEARQALRLTESWSDGDVRWSVRAALAARLCELDEIAAASDVLESVHGLWHGETLPSLAKALLRRADRRGALALIPNIPHRPWKAEILALAAHGADADVADTAIADAEAAADLEPPSRVSVLARAAEAAPVRYQPTLCTTLVAAARGIEDYYERSVALSTAAAALVACGDPDGALAVSREPPVDQLRAEALGRVLAVRPAITTIQGVADQAASLRDRPARAGVRLGALGAALAATSGQVEADRTGEAETMLPALFDSALSDLSSGPRDQLLASLPTLLQAVEHLDGPDAVWTVAADLAAIEKWWP
jgi:hypothetical protein